MWDRTIEVSKSDFIHLKKSDFFHQKKSDFFHLKKSNFSIEKNRIFFNLKKSDFFYRKKLDFCHLQKSNSHNPISKTRLYSLTYSRQKSNCRGPQITPQCIKLNLRGLNRHPDSEIDSKISKKIHKIYFRYPKIIW